nr:aldo/keto reductase [Spiractinospora alimapuensis]
MHWPNPSQDEYPQAWQALVDLRREGLIRSIGVSNFMPEHLERLQAESGVVPSVNQIEMHPFFPQAEQRADDESRGIRTESWSPIGRANALLTHPVLQRIATAHERTVAQVILRWHYQLGAIPIPKATSPERQRENLALFDFALTETEVQEITALGRLDGRNKNQDPRFHEES